MIEEIKTNEKGYRGVKLPSYSLLKRIDNSGPKAIISEFKGGSEAMEFGDLVDCLLLQPEELDNKFYFKSVEKPTKQILELADAVYAQGFVYDLGVPKTEIELSRVSDLSKDLKLFGSVKNEDIRITKFNTDLFWNYINALYESKNKTVLSPRTYEDAIEAIRILKTHDKTRDIFNPSSDIEAIDQLKLQGDVDGQEVKIMMDRLHINHKTKTITPYDLKCTDIRLQSFLFIFMKMKYYLQSSLYSYILTQWAKETYPDYVVEEFRFVVYSRSDKYPAIWVVSDTWLNKGFYGFTDYKNSKVKGVKELLNDYYYYMETNQFEIERDFIENNEIYIL